ncbi:hypothetical protein BO71DRAFT_404105 [Aspergillus ellipticus CBS 707.79]|uniref:Serine hydrolase domain-containing protein n=1 Tax=Aspergillus ellipticus CBS 707.79 TaxID=1448320 RepID=A0A319CTQ4_9EURO|nr:hypothetical protein BO71DRAFT_404105 [Aspergillus ellipticus CBS 707.79]
MRFLCLHGMGTNGRIFESQTAAIRHSLGGSHTYEWLDGSIVTDPAPGLEEMVSSADAAEDEFLMYVSIDLPASHAAGLRQLEHFIATEGPFDGLMAFSQGAACAATYLIHRIQQDQPHAFRCAIFFCGGAPNDPRSFSGVDCDDTRDHGSVGRMTSSPAVEAAAPPDPSPRALQFTQQDYIDIPTAHIWGANDLLWRFGPDLSQVCMANVREVFVHPGGHEIPGPKDAAALAQSVRVIRRTLARASRA